MGLDENATGQVGEEKSYGTKMGDDIVWSFRQDHACRVTEGQQIVQVGSAPVGVALR